MFVRCTDCDWSQDDFWDADYNPVTAAAGELPRFLEMLARPPADRRTVWREGRQVQVESAYRDELASRFSELATRVLGMRWWTWAEYQADPDRACPICDSKELTVD